ncbi:DUF1127 domain-containing protein [Rhodobacteraceae bacterium NNCM2]|nr:DUF1127 domain-containing protein [Coraliihabitans acroporae]
MEHSRGTAISPVGLSISGVLAQIAIWRERAESRARLAQLTQEQLDDIGVSAAEADREASKPFWRA